MIDSSDTNTSFPNVKDNQLVVPALDRSHQGAVYICQASNNNISTPASTRVTVDMLLKPMMVAIETQYQPLSADREYEIECVSAGSRPPAKITWWRDNRELTSSSYKVSDDGNVTMSKLVIRPVIKDNGGRLICRADNPRVARDALEEVWKLDITYVPRIKLELGSNLNPQDIEEGDDVYFECNIDANPKAYKVVWRHNNQVIQLNQKSGVIVSNEALALQNVKREQSGNYTCFASNVEGDGESEVVSLRIMYKPLCKESGKTTIGVGKGEGARVLCEVESYPPPDGFQWSFNNSAADATIDISPDRFHNSLALGLSTLSYTPLSDLDYGTVMCWASNTAGLQVDPCVFQIIPAGKPDSPVNCTLVNQTISSVEVDCAEGYDGGQAQTFQLEVYDVGSQFLAYNLSSRAPNFGVAGLSPGVSLRLRIYAHNTKGRSDPIFLEAFTLKAAEKQTGAPVPFAVTPIVVVLMVTSLVLVTCAIIVFAAVKIRGNGRHSSSPSVVARPQKKNKKIAVVRADVREVYESDDPNPDVIPCNKESEYQLVFNSEAKDDHIEMTKDNSNSIPYVSLQPKLGGTLQNGDLFKSCSKRKSEDFLAGEELRLTGRGVGGCCSPTIGGGGSGFGDVRTRPSCEGPLSSYCIVDDGQNHHQNPQNHHPCLSPTSGGPTMLPHREIISVRTPLMGNTPESCV
ncbi:nephrosis 1, congenital, Finnish type (nephrin) [Nesidiocoris tenuis]|uniref:Nephrosis 1, congenital, Finnish type (Nephrin) n=1 Tax=Nesidiocoris tenuis TaxID=355587 RepID=A0ABN7AI52_9HEMI|nr:nephrosis 1, congenital, Finnish type (nephrin) [Nesidiocoris tenuis]